MIQVRTGSLNMGHPSVLVASLGRLSFHHGGTPPSTDLSTRSMAISADFRRSHGDRREAGRNGLRRDGLRREGGREVSALEAFDRKLRPATLETRSRHLL